MKNYVIYYHEQAQKDLLDLTAYIALDDKDTAINFRTEIENVISTLSTFPNIGKEVSTKECRRIIKKPYIIYYEVNELTQEIAILYILHGARVSK
ncbi:MAG: type II toxin-antitoxin system RelE/ParE family toxin [Firmicutes bacterium]|nr:type II toxin-antitoxin system RelE/ParE family toxin [Bacillota bacterium]